MEENDTTPARANITDPFRDLFAPLTGEEQQALAQRLADHVYRHGRPPTRQRWVMSGVMRGAVK